MKKIGVLGGGQLGRMLLQAAINYPVEMHILENDPNCPAAGFCQYFSKGDITNFDDVVEFGKNLDAITIEIEQVNTGALNKLEEMGVAVFPKASIITTIKNKIQQKQFFVQNQIPTSPFITTQTNADIAAHPSLLPGVHKLAMGGYDGRGVQVIQSLTDAGKGFSGPAVLEKMVTIKKEISQLIAIDQKGKYTYYPIVDMVFDTSLNMLSHQICPAHLPMHVQEQIRIIAAKVAKSLNSPGVFAIEFFVNDQDEVLVNEIAPRVHNSGHHTIEASYSSQFDMLLRIILGYPLGSTENRTNAALINLIGAPGYHGTPIYRGLEKALNIENVFVHIYGKLNTKPGRKMGHITITDNDIKTLKEKVKEVKKIISVEA